MLMPTETTEICTRLVELHRQRQDLHRAEKSLTLRIKAKCRRLGARMFEEPTLAQIKTEGDKIYKTLEGKGGHEYTAHAFGVSMPFMEARSLINTQRKQVEKSMEAEAKRLPVAWFVEQTRGFGYGGLASIIGEAGNLSNYATVSRLWKRMGLAVINGERQQRKPGAESELHGYSPSRRAVMWTVGDSMFRSDGHYSGLCRERKKYEYEKAVERGLVPATTMKPTAESWREVLGLELQVVSKLDPSIHMGAGHIHNRAKRYMEKRFLRDLWRAWRDSVQ